MPLEMWIFGAFLVVMVAAGLWRWNVANQAQLEQQQCEALSEQVVQDLFERVPDAQVFQGISRSYWRSLPLTDSEWIYLCRWMEFGGLVHTPNGWGWLAIILNNPPEGLALTRKAFKLETRSHDRPSISIGDGNSGNINIDGTQMVIAGESISADNLASLISALRNDSASMSEQEAMEVREAACLFEEVLSGVRSRTDPKVSGALTWVRQRVSEAVGSAGGAALWAGTVAIAHAIGWV